MSLPLRVRCCLYLLAPMCLLAGRGAADELWLQPLHFFVAPGTTLPLRVLIGTQFVGTPWPGSSTRLLRLAHVAPTGLLDLTATATATDTLYPRVTLQHAGTHVVALSTTNAFVTLSPDSFNAYLKQHGLDYILVERQRRGSLDAPAREAYRRCAKVLVQAGSPSASDTTRAWSRPAGLPLELVPEQNPYTLKAGAALTLRVLADGQPRAGQLVQLWQRSPGRPPQISRLYSNQNGRVLFRLTGPGEYLLSTVQMVPAVLPQADWQSTWSTLTFGFRPVLGR